MPYSVKPFGLVHFKRWVRGLELDSGARVRLEPFQERFVRDVFSGRKICWLVVGEGNGKTTLLAALGLYALRFSEEASVPIAASSRDQARIMYRQMRGFVKRSGLEDPDEDGLWFEAYDGYREIQLRSKGRTKRGEVLGRLEIHAADAKTADGVIPFPYAFLDELHRHADLSLHRTWAGKLNKRGAQLIVISTAGEPGQDFELTRERLRAEATEVSEDGGFGRYLSERAVLHDYRVVGDINDMEAVKEANPLKAITTGALAEKRNDPTMTERHWRRFTCNLATPDEGKDPYLELEDWDRMAADPFALPEGPVCVGADGSRKWDTTVVAWAATGPDGVVWVDARVFSAREEAAHHVLHEHGRIDFDDVEAFISDLADTHDVSDVAFDPRYLERSMDLLSSRLPESQVGRVEPQSKAMRDALQALYNLVAEDKLRHPGDDVIRQHIANCGVDRGESSEIRRVRKLDVRLPIDAVPAIAMAVWKAAEQTSREYVIDPFQFAA